MIDIGEIGPRLILRAIPLVFITPFSLPILLTVCLETLDLQLQLPVLSEIRYAVTTGTPANLPQAICLYGKGFVNSV